MSFPRRPLRLPRHAAVALDVEFAHWRTGAGRTVLRVPAEVAVVGEAPTAPPLLHARLAPPPLPPDAVWVGGVRPGGGDDEDERAVADVAADIAALLAGGATLVGHGLASDLASLRLPPPARCVDTAAVLAGAASTPSLAALARRVLGTELRAPAAAHSARDDARAVMAIYLASGRPGGGGREERVEEEAGRILEEWERRRRTREV